MCIVEYCKWKPNPSGKGLCRKHYDQMRKYGKVIIERTKGNRNDYINKGEYTELRIVDKYNNIIKTALIDNDMVDELKNYSFRASDKYIKTVKNNKTLYLHQIIMGKEDGLEVDHINRDKLDNRRNNLRLCSHKVNCMNR